MGSDLRNQTSPPLLVPAPGAPLSVAGPGNVMAGDLNGDRHPDFLVTSGKERSVRIFLNDGRGRFSPASESPLRLDFYPSEIALGDLNADGNVDLGIASHDSYVISLFTGNGKGEVDNGTVLGPHLVVAGPIIQGPLPFQMPLFISVKDAAEARQTVQKLKTRGVDFIKVQDAIPNDIYQAVAAEANRLNICFMGHIPPNVLLEEAIDLGQHSIEHMGGRFWGVLIGTPSAAALHISAEPSHLDFGNTPFKIQFSVSLHGRGSTEHKLDETGFEL